MEIELNQVDEGDGQLIAWDDMKGARLDLGKVKKARALEMKFIKDRQVYRYAKKAEAKLLGKKIIGVKWLDTNKGDDEDENYRSRLVAQEISRGIIAWASLRQSPRLR